METLEPRVLLSGTTFIVSSLADAVANDGVVTLREAILAANTNTAVTDDVIAGSATETDVITFDQPALSAEAGVPVGNPLTITLDGTELEITGDLDIVGLGAEFLTIDADDESRVLSIATGTVVSLAGLTLAGGSTTGDGGGIDNWGTLTATNLTVSGNSAFHGGGIRNSSGLTLNNTTVSGNLAAYGGGILNQGSLHDGLALTNSVVAGNSASSNGGGIFNHSHTALTLTNTTISGNSASSDGGGIYNYGTLALNNSIVSLNESARDADIQGSFTAHSSLVGVDPSFVRNPSPGADGSWGTADDDYGDLRLLDTSLAVNFGDDSLAVDAYGAALTVDWDGNPRIVNGRVDIGAYEYQAPSTPRETLSSVVTTLADVVDSTDGVISLREALVYGGTLDEDVSFATSLSGGTIILGGRELYVYHSLTIDATPIGGMTIDAAGQSRVLSLATDKTASLAGLTLTGGSMTIGYGAGIYSSGTLTLTDSTVWGNSASDDGGGIYHRNGILTLTDTTVSGNSASDGGGIYISSSGALTLTNSTVSGNSASDRGGGIYQGYGILTLTNTTVSGNSAYDGGGICISSSGTLALTNSTVSENSSDRDGGGICNYYGILKLTRSTVSSNSADGYGGGISNLGTLTLTDSTVTGNSAFRGGGFYDYTQTVLLTNCFVSGNSAVREGGGIYISSYGTLTLVNTTVSGNSASNGGGGLYNLGMLTLTNSTVSGNSASGDGGGIYNSGTLILNSSIVSLNEAPAYADISGSFAAHSSLVGMDPGFVRNPSSGADSVWGTADDDYGDLRLASGSVCIDAGDNALVPADTADLDGDGDTAEPIPFDLAGNPRFVDDPDTSDTGVGSPPVVDMGAYEHSPVPGDANWDGAVNLSDLGILATNWGSQAADWAQADFNGDGKVDLSDLGILATWWGTSAQSADGVVMAAAAPVVEEVLPAEPGVAGIADALVEPAIASVGEGLLVLNAPVVDVLALAGLVTLNSGAVYPASEQPDRDLDSAPADPTNLTLELGLDFDLLAGLAAVA